MKKISFLFLFIWSVWCAGFFTSCGNDDPEPDPGKEEPTPDPDDDSDLLADLAFKAFNDAFLITEGTTQYYRENLYTKEKEYFWCQALVVLMVQDVYERDPKEEYKTLIRNLLDTFLKQNQGKAGLHDWAWNEFNDDLLWAALIFARGYGITGDKEILDQAIYAYDLLYNRGWDDQLGGGIWWDIKYECKSGLSNNPAVTLACYLYEYTKDQKYLDQAIAIYDWVYKNLFDQDTGAVYENMQPNGDVHKEGADNVYNSGAFIEAANYLYKITGDKWYYDDAKMAVDYIINHKTENGIMSKGQRDGTWQSEFARGMGAFVKDNNLWSMYYPWMRKNADAAWNTRRRDINITWNKWVETTPNENMRAVECVSAVVMLQVVPERNPAK